MAFKQYTTAAQLCELLDNLRRKRPRVGFDIEGYAATGITDCSFAISASEAIWVPLRRVDNSPWWSPGDEQQVLASLRGVLEDADVFKVMHNALYELFVCKWAHGIDIRGIGGDTMLLWHELYAELEKALDVAASIMTRQSYWKFGRQATTERERAEYNCIDSCVTLELETALLVPGVLTPKQLAHYRHRVALLEPTCYQMIEGFRFDGEARADLLTRMWRDIYTLQGELDRLAGIEPPTMREVIETCCNKRKWETCIGWSDVMAHANKKWKEQTT